MMSRLLRSATMQSALRVMTIALAVLSQPIAQASEGGPLGTLGSVTIIYDNVRVGLPSIVDPNCTAIKYQRIEIWALTSPYSPIQGRQGYRIATQDLGLRNCTVSEAKILDLPLSSPPPGSYYPAIFLMGSPMPDCRTQDGYCILDHQNTALHNFFFSGANARASAAFTPAVGLWWNPNESGTGYSFDVKRDVLVATVFTYKPNGDSEWYLASGPLTESGTHFSAPLEKYRGGPCIACKYTGAPLLAGTDGVLSITFTSATSAVVTLPAGGVTHIQPQEF
jgi:hypothetical protein